MRNGRAYLSLVIVNCYLFIAMIAYVLSGGNLRGALQVGALQALLKDPARQPDFVVGTSIGSINGAMLAYDPTPGGMEKLAHIWRNVKRSDVYPGQRLGLARRLVRGRDSLYTDRPLRRMCQLAMPPQLKTFADLKIPHCKWPWRKARLKSTRWMWVSPRTNCRAPKACWGYSIAPFR